VSLSVAPPSTPKAVAPAGVEGLPLEQPLVADLADSNVAAGRQRGDGLTR
jgi:hypothetical protein